MSDFPQRLLAGYDSFISSRFGHERARYASLAETGQAPRIMVIACCDSRAAPETIFDAGPGELFVVRNVANLVPPYAPDGEYHGTSAALEFAVKVLQVQHIVLMGHGRCGGIQAALSHMQDALSPGDFLGKWTSLLRPAADTLSAAASLLTEAEQQTALERISIRYSLANLRTFPFVAEREREGALALHGAWFDIGLGELWTMNPDTGDFARPSIVSPLGKSGGSGGLSSP
jgi:carbonic anhydrase